MRARNLKPGFFKNEELADLPMAGRILFQGLWCMADREGRLEDRPKRIKAEVLPYDDVDVDQLLQQLHERGFIVRYRAGNTEFIQIITFAKHQRPHTNESKSVIPGPDEYGSETHQGEQGDTPRPQALRSDSLNTDTPFTDSLTADVLNAECLSQAREGARGEQDAPYAVFAAYLDELGKGEPDVSPAFKAQQLGIAKGLLDDGFGAAKVRAYLRYLLAQDWRDEPITLKTVRKGIAGWEANGSPSLPKSRASPRANGNGRLSAAEIFQSAERKRAIEAQGSVRP